MGNCSLDGVSWKVSETTEKVETINAHLLEDLRIRDAWRARSNIFADHYDVLVEQYNELKKQHDKLLKVNAELSKAISKISTKSK